MNSIIRANTELSVEDFGRSRVAEASARLLRKRGVGALKDDALEELLSMLRADEEVLQRFNAESRALYAKRAQAPECPYCGATHGLRIASQDPWGGNVDYICAGCFTGRDDGPEFDDLRPAEHASSRVESA